MRSLLTAGLLAGLALAPQAWAQDAPAPEVTPETAAEGAAAGEVADYDAATVLATVDGTEITLGNVIVMRERLPAQYQDLPDDVLLSGIVEQLVDQTLLANQLSASAAADPLAVRLHLENERRGTLAARVVEDRIGQAVDEAEVQSVYDESVAEFQPAPEFSASHVLVESEERAAALLAEIEGGADFAEVAQANSSDGSAAQGGALGWFGAGQMVPPFEAAVSGIEVGEIAGPVETEFGWHLIKLDDKRETAPPPLEQVRADIENQVRQAALEAELEGLRAGAQIELADPGLPAVAIRESDLLAD